MHRWERTVASALAVGVLGMLAAGSASEPGSDEAGVVSALPAPTRSAEAPPRLPAPRWFAEPDREGRLCRSDEQIGYGCDGEEGGRIELCAEGAEAGSPWLQLRVRLADGTEGALPHDPSVRFTMSEEMLPAGGERAELAVEDAGWRAVLVDDRVPDADGLVEPRGRVVLSRDGSVVTEYACDPRFGVVRLESVVRSRVDQD